MKARIGRRFLGGPTSMLVGGLILACGPSEPGDGGTEASGALGSSTADPSISDATTSSVDAGSQDESAGASTTGEMQPSSTTGSAAGCPGGCVDFPLDCSRRQCGGLSIYDEDGCVRPNCAEEGAGICGEGEVCYIGWAFGRCISGGWSCGDDPDEMTCICGGSGDCGGGFCVPLDLHPQATPGPSGAGIVEDVCTRARTAALGFTIGSGSPACTTEPVEHVYVELEGIEPGPGIHHFGEMAGSGSGLWSDGAGPPVQARFGFLHVEAWDETAVQGSYYMWLEETNTLSGTFEAFPCLDDVACR